MQMIKLDEDKLFEEWSQQRPGFVADGVVDETAYKKSECKLLFVLKEVNDPDGGEWDLREFLRECKRPQTWDNIARWVHGIRNINNVPEWNFYKEIDDNFRINTLRSICAVNLKKSPGGHTADNGSIWHVMQQDQQYLKKQLSFYSPDLVVCCGTGDMFHWVLSQGGDDYIWKTTSRGVYHFDWNGIPVLAFPHPEARIPSNILTYAFIDAAKEILHN
jgi:hypothetical protein